MPPIGPDAYRGISYPQVTVGLSSSSGILLCEGTEHVYLGRELHQRRLRFSTQHDVSTFAVLLAAFNILLYRYTGENDIIVGAIPHGLPCQEIFEEEVHAGISSPVALRTNISDIQLRIRS
ncbi:MAG: hypothetical protein AB7T38_09510 [Nitrospirales bacterium]